MPNGIRRVISPQAAQMRSIRRLEKRQETIEKEIQRRDRRLFEERMRQARAERVRAQQIRRRAGIQDEERALKKDLIASIAKGEGVGMFGAKMPRINTFIVHAGTEDPTARARLTPRQRKGLDFTPIIDQKQLDRLKVLSAQAREQKAARALALSTKGVVLPRTKAEDALADLGADFFPEFQPTGAVPDEPMPDVITGGPFVPAGAPGAAVQPSDIAQLGISPAGAGLPPVAAGEDIDITQLARTGLVGPGAGLPTTPGGFLQGFQGADEPATPIQNIHEIIQQFGVGGQQRGSRKAEDFAAFEAALGRPATTEEKLRFFKAAEKEPSLRDQFIFDFLRKRFKLDEPTGREGREPARPAAAAPAAAAPTRAAPRAAPTPPTAAQRQQDLRDARREFFLDNPNRSIENIRFDEESGLIVILDDQEELWFVEPVSQQRTR